MAFYDMVNPNLDAGCPVLLTIMSGQHEVVGDGYGYNLSTLYHHLNFGWAGSSDAWYNLPTDSKVGAVVACIYNVWTNGTGEIISGRITDGGGTPISGVVVTATRTGGGTYTATSNAKGIYALARIPSLSQYTLSAIKTGYSFTSQTVTTGKSGNYSYNTGNRGAQDFPPVPHYDYYYAIIDGTVTITAYIGNGGEVTITNAINGLPVTSIGDSAFYNCGNLSSVTIPNSVTNIGNSAFANCSNLSSVSLRCTGISVFWPRKSDCLCPAKPNAKTNRRIHRLRTNTFDNQKFTDG